MRGERSGHDRRDVVTNRPGAFVLPDATTMATPTGGESENRNKNSRVDCRPTASATTGNFAISSGCYLHAAAYNLLVRLRHVIADPPTPPPPHDVPTEAPARHSASPMAQPPPRARYHWAKANLVLAHAIDQSRRSCPSDLPRVIVELSASWPYLKQLRKLLSVSLTAYSLL